MDTYIALLRGINVSGQKKIKMANLREQLGELGFQNVKTYIQSGNIIFMEKEVDIQTLEKAIHDKIFSEYGFEVPVLIKKPGALVEVVQQNPFKGDEDKDPSRWYVTFLAEEPAPERVALLKEVDYSPEEYVLMGKNIYFYSPKGYGRAKMNNNFFEKKLKVFATTRNWKTVNKLIELAGEMET